MLNAKIARNFAEAVFGRPDRNWITFGTTRFNTNRRGAFWFECSNSKGFVIDARALTEEQRTNINRYTTSHTAIRFFNPNQPRQSDGYLNPFTSRDNQLRSMENYEGYERAEFEVYALPATPQIQLGSGCYLACLPVVFANITVPGRFEHKEAFEVFKQDFKPTDATLRALGADKWLTPKTEPTPGFF
ncbi:hypothetical protein [Sulfitobacter sp. R18_1]|uniref:hypothetical protein n=1 Tax=Sulfitobacter sp. R18_1 TaxID=2821104 RepID=UPI001ADA93AC|nr:hypothetical protein [Sulfitobacter sp. R18_1]MBO9428084.1 hypothetical protein [Sulfitobacter sp. R18_1]